jgi:hypothetical protein
MAAACGPATRRGSPSAAKGTFVVIRTIKIFGRSTGAECWGCSEDLEWGLSDMCREGHLCVDATLLQDHVHDHVEHAAACCT